MDTRTLRADGLLLLTALIWGAAFVAQRVGMDHVGPFTFNGVRFALGAAALVPLAMRSAGASKKPLPAKKALMAGLFAGSALFLGSTFQQVGIVYTTAGNAGFITGLYVVIVPLLGLFFSQRPHWTSWAGAVMAAAGLYLLSVKAGLSMGLGDFLVFIGAFFWSAHVLIVGYYATRMNAVRFATAQYAVCSALSLAAAFLVETPNISGIMDAGIPILYGGLMSVGVAYTLQVVAQQDAPPTHAAIILSLEGAFAALTGWLLLSETIAPRGLAGCGLMLGGMLLAQLGPSQPAMPAVEE